MSEVELLPTEDIPSIKNNLDILDDDDYTDMPELCQDTTQRIKEEDKCDKPEEIEIEDEEKDLFPGGQLGVWEDILGSGRLMKKVLVEGSMHRPNKGERVTINYRESLEESSDCIKEEKSFEFNLGESEVLQALDLIVPLMLVGETCLVQSEPDFLYGSQGDEDRVPPDTKLFITVDLLSSSQLPNPSELSVEERDRIGNQKRLRGNSWYTRGEYSQAIQCYRKAVEYLDDESIDSEVEVPIDRFLLPRPVFNLLECRVKAFNNMAQAQMKLSAWDSALASVKQVLKIEPNNEKALYRKAVIYKEKCKTDEALGVLRRVTRMYPANKLAQVELSNMLAKRRQGLEKEQSMSKKMLEITDMPAAVTKQDMGLWNQQTKLILACVGGLGAILGAIIAKTYQLY